MISSRYNFHIYVNNIFFTMHINVPTGFTRLDNELQQPHTHKYHDETKGNDNNNGI